MTFSLRRRAFLASTALLPVAACTTTGGIAMTPAAIVAQVTAATAGLAGALHQIALSYPALIPAATATVLSADLAKAQAAAAVLSASLPAASGATTVQTVEGYLNAFLSTVAAPPINGLIPAPFNMAFAAASVLLPSFEAFINTYISKPVVTPPAAMTARTTFLAAAGTITSTDQAVSILQSYAGK